MVSLLIPLKNHHKILLFSGLIFVIARITTSTTFAQSVCPVINEIMSLNATTIQDEDGDYADWIEIFNPGTVTINLAGYGLSDDPNEPFKWTFPEMPLESRKHLLIFASDKDRRNPAAPYLHTNFKLKSGGEFLLLTNAAGTKCDSLKIASLSADVSLGRQPDGGAEWLFFTEATPGKSNRTQGFTGTADSVLVSLPGGFYATGQSVRLSTSSPTAKIYYTLDGAEPGVNANLYRTPINIRNTTVLRARAFEPNLMPGKITTQTYFINEETLLPVISLATHPDNLFDEDIGIYVVGNGTALGGYPSNPIGPPANYWEDWERPIHIEFFEPDGRLGFKLDAGVKMTGKTSRNLPQKSFAIFARNKYGYREINYPIFPDVPITRFKSIVLRNAGSDNTHNQGAVHFRDGLTATLVKELALDKQAYRPAFVFANGEYWGIYNIREKLNEDYLAAHHGVDPDKVDLLDDYHTLYPLVVEGDARHYNALIDYLLVHDLSDEAAADYVKIQMYVHNFLDYMAAQIYFANQDGPGHNCKFWRPKTADGKYRWLLYDTDHAFGMRIFVPYFHFEPEAYKDNTIGYYRQPDGPSWPNPPESTFLFRKILENENFKYAFINRLSDYLNTIFAPETVLQKIETVFETIEPALPRHLERWSGSLNTWYENVEIVQTFAEYRLDYLREHIVNEFGLSGMAEVTLAISPANSGAIKINTSYITQSPWQGTYFQGVPIQLTALPHPGYQFTGWSGGSAEKSRTLLITLTNDLALTANFEFVGTATTTVVINEINYNSATDFDPEDWIELYNPHGCPLDISGWIFTDATQSQPFVLPPNTIIPPDNYLVLCRDTAAFHEHFPDVRNFIGNFQFGLKSTGETIRLFNPQRTLVDSVTYQSTAPWPSQPNGNGPTLALRHPELNNALPENWTASPQHGTPGAPNDPVSRIHPAFSSKKPTQFILHQNYPNPFNALTKIRYSLSRPLPVKLKIFDITGKRVSVLVNSPQAAGIHEIQFNGNGFASGVYFCRLQAGGGVAVRRLVLLN